MEKRTKSVKISRNQDLIRLKSVHDRASTKTTLIELNINGLKYQMIESVFLQLPILDRIRSAAVEVFNQKTQKTEYFLDTDASSFLAIVEYLKNGELHLPPTVCPNVFKKEMEFWGIDFMLLRPCCFIKLSSFNTDENRIAKYNRNFNLDHPTYISRKLNGWRHVFYNFFNNPKSSMWARGYHIFTLLVMILTVFELSLSTSPVFRHPLHQHQWAEYFTHDKNELNNLCGDMSKPMTTELHEICIAYQNKELDGLTKRSVRTIDNSSQLDVRERLYEHRQLKKPILKNEGLTHTKSNNIGIIIGDHSSIGHHVDISTNLSKNKHISEIHTAVDKGKSVSFASYSRGRSTPMFKYESNGSRNVIKRNIALKYMRNNLSECIFDCIRLSEPFCNSTVSKHIGPVLGLPKDVFAVGHWMYEINYFCFAFYMCDYSFRFCVAPKKKRFAFSFFGITRLLSLVSYIIVFIVTAFSPRFKFTLTDDLDTLKSFQILIVFNIGQFFRPFTVLIFSIKNNFKNMFTLVLYISILSLVFATIIYSIEPKNMVSIPNAFYFVVTTMTSVGYGNPSPISVGGKLVAGIISITGVFFLAVTIPIVVTDFVLFHTMYTNESYLEQCLHAKANAHLIGLLNKTGPRRNWPSLFKNLHNINETD